MKIYFDGSLINPDYYTQLKQNRLMFNDKEAFFLGASVCSSLTLGIDKNYISTMPTNVTIEFNNETYGNYIIDNIEEDEGEYIFTITDKMVNFMFNYDASVIINASSTTTQSGQKYVTLLQILQDICTKANITLATTDFIGKDKQISWYDNTISARTYIEYIAELNGGYAIINKDGELELRQFQSETPVKSIDIDECDSFKIGEHHIISKVLFDNGLVAYDAGTDTNDTLYVRTDNVYITSQEDITNIYNVVNNLEFYSFKVENCPIDNDVETGDCIAFVDTDNNIYKTIAQYDLEYDGGWIGGYKLDVATNKQQETQIIGTDKKVKSIQTKLNRDEAQLQIISESTIDPNNPNSLTNQVADVRVQYNEVISKLGEVADITISGESNEANVTLENVNASQPIDIKIHPIGENICYLYPSNYLYPANQDYPAKEGLVPSGTLTPSGSLVPSTGYPAQGIKYPRSRTLRFTNTETDEVFNWILPTNLWWYNSTTYDEMELSYGDGVNSSVIVTRKCQVNSDGSISVLANPTTETYEYPSELVLTDGDYNIQLVDNTSGYLFVQLMAKNIYTTQFYTKAETNSLVSQTASEITTQVSAEFTRVDGEIDANTTRITQNSNSITSLASSKVGNNEIISKINQTPEAITISASKLNLTGYITASDLSSTGATTINGSNITTGTINASLVKTGTLDASQFNVTNLSANSITGGTINGNNVNVTNINADNITSGTISANKINGGTITASAINLGSSKFRVTTGGVVTATSGTIGGWSMSSESLYRSATYSGITSTIYLNAGGLVLEQQGSSGTTIKTASWLQIINSASDKRLKNNISYINKESLYDDLFNELNPVTFKYNKELDPINYNKIHFGFIAQDILNSEEKNKYKDLALVYKDGDYYSLDKQEIIALNTWQIQKLKKKIEELERKLK